MQHPLTTTRIFLDWSEPQLVRPPSPRSPEGTNAPVYVQGRLHLTEGLKPQRLRRLLAAFKREVENVPDIELTGDQISLDAIAKAFLARRRFTDLDQMPVKFRLIANYFAPQSGREVCVRRDTDGFVAIAVRHRRDDPGHDHGNMTADTIAALLADLVRNQIESSHGHENHLKELAEAVEFPLTFIAPIEIKASAVAQLEANIADRAHRAEQNAAATSDLQDITEAALKPDFLSGHTAESDAQTSPVARLAQRYSAKMDETLAILDQLLTEGTMSATQGQANG